jgi:DNA-binding transcriptional ArsR family regulator
MTDVTNILEKSEEVASRLKLIANANRLRIACRILKGEISVGDIEMELNIRQPTLSREIAKLRDGGVITARRKSKVVFYSLTDPKMKRLIEAVCQASSSSFQTDSMNSNLSQIPRSKSVDFDPRPKFRNPNIPSNLKPSSPPPQT